MKRIAAFAAGTAAVLAFALGFQAYGTSGHDEQKHTETVQTADTADQTGTSTTADGSAGGSGVGSADKPGDDTTRAGYTDDHAGKPGENK